MNIKSIRITAVLTLSIFFITQSYAFEKVGTTSFQFLKVTTHARAVGMGEAFIAVANNSEGVFYNPAALVGVQKFDFSAAYLDWFLDINHYSFTASYTDATWGSFGLQAMYTDIGEIRVTTVEALGFVGEKYLGYTGETIRPNALVIGLTYAKELTEKFAFGLTMKYVREDIGNTNWISRKTGSTDNLATGVISFDGGLTYDTGFRSLKISAVVRHFGPEVEYFDKIDLPKVVGDSTYYQEYTGKGYPLPQTFVIGIAGYLFSPHESILFNSESQSLLLSFDMVQPRDFDQQYNLGLEYGFKNILFLRGGYKLNYDEESYSLGFGIAYEDYRIDYAFSDMGNYLDSVHRFSFGFAFN